MKKNYIQPSLIVALIATNNICVNSVKSNLEIKQGKPTNNYTDAV